MVFTVVVAVISIPIFTNTCFRARLSVCLSLNTVPLVCGIDASIKFCDNNNMDNNVTTSANICTDIFILFLYWN